MNVLKAVKWFFIVFLIFLCSLFFREQRLPKSWVERATHNISSTNFVVSCESASFGFRRGLSLVGLNAYDLTRPNRLEPVVQARLVAVDFLARDVRIVGAKYTRLPESYYSSECHERNEPLDVEFPKLGDFRLVLEQPDILGIRPERVSTQVSVHRRWIAFDDIRLDWRWQSGPRTSVDGSWRVDLNEQKVTGEVHGLATQAQIRPLLEALDIVSSFEYIDAFTDIPAPIPARGDFVIDLVRGDFGMSLTLQPQKGCYRGVPLSYAEGTLGVQTGIRGTNCNVALTVDLPAAADIHGRMLSGKLGVTLSNNVARLSYDVTSGLAWPDALKIAEFLAPEDISCVECYTHPSLRVKGTSGTTASDSGHNDIAFEARLEHGAFLGFKLNDAISKFTLKGDVLDFNEVTATGRSGGKVSAPGQLRIPDFDPERAEFATKVTYTGGSLEELADFLRFDLGERSGRVDGWCELSAPASTNFAERLNGKGHVKISDGRLAQMKMFAGLTSQLAEKVPGVGFLVNQSQASADFAISNGVFRSDNIYIEGGLVSLKGWGAYDIPRDDLDFTVRVQFLKEESLMGKIIHPVTFPFTKLLLEFKANGPIDAPKWEYISIIDRIL